MRGSSIILSAIRQGKFDEGIITDTSKPGTLLEIVPGTALSSGRPSFRARSAAAGAKGPIIVLLEDSLQGKLATDAYVANTRCSVYWPQAGEELNLLLGNVAGTGDTVTIGDLFGVNNDGTLIANSAYTSAPFQAMETTTALLISTLIFVKYLGNQS